MVVLIKITYRSDGQLIGARATLTRPRLADRQTDLFGGNELIASDVLFKTTKAVHRKNTEVILTGASAEGDMRRAVPCNFIVK